MMAGMLLAVLLSLPGGTAWAANHAAAARHWELARAYVGKGWPSRALAEARVVLELDPGHAGAKSLVESRGMRLAEADSAAPPREAPSADPVAEALRAYRESRVADARKIAGMVLAGDPSSTAATRILDDLDEEEYRPPAGGADEVLGEIYGQGIVFYRRGEWERAQESFQRALAIEPSHGQAGTFHGRARERAESAKVAAGLEKARAAREAGREAEARDALVRVLALDPRNAEAKAGLDSLGGGPLPPERQAQVREHFNRGVEAYGEGRWPDAVREWEIVTSLDPKDAEAKRLLRKAQAKVRAARKDAGRRIPGMHEEALKLYQQGKADEARKIYRAILDLDPGDAKAKSSLELIDGKARQ